MASLLVLAKKIAICLIRIYQYGISPIIGRRCRFQITCSQYGINSIHKFGILKGSWKTCIRILRCHPLTVRNKKIFYFFKYANIRNVLNMDSQRNFFIIVFLIISFILWQAWEIEYPQISNLHIIQNTDNNNHNTYNKQISHIVNGDNLKNKNSIDNHFIIVKTDVFLLKINLYGGNIEEAYLIKYLENLNSKEPLHLLHTTKEFKYQINSGLINEYTLNNMNKTKQLLYTTASNKNEYVMPDYTDELQLTLKHTDNNDITYIKRYVLNRNNYSISVYHTINNMSLNPIHVKLFGNLIQTIHFPQSYNHNNENKFPLYAYRGTAYSTDKTKYQKYSFKDIQHTDLNIFTNGGWVAMLQKYFVTAWLPIVPQSNVLYTSHIDTENISIGFKSDSICIPEGKTIELKSILWIGPKIQEKMKSIAPNLDLVIDYGWLWFISQPLFKLLQFIYNYIHNWGISIILITLIIRLIMYPLTKAQYTSMAKIRMLQPKLAVIQEEYKYDKYQYHQKTIELYKEKKVNPLGGCLPLLIQMPIFLALYYMLSGSVELRHAKFTLWINDLSAQDPYYILPIIMGITMFFIQKLSPTTVTDPIQKKIMTAMLIIFTIFFLWFPSGLVLYYIISNVITIAQQQIIYHGLSKKGLHNKKHTD